MASNLAHVRPVTKASPSSLWEYDLIDQRIFRGTGHIYVERADIKQLQRAWSVTHSRDARNTGALLDPNVHDAVALAGSTIFGGAEQRSGRPAQNHAIGGAAILAVQSDQVSLLPSAAGRGWRG